MHSSQLDREHYSSPSKRKHNALESDQDDVVTSSLFVPRIDAFDDDPQSRGAESPRSKVAERLQGLQLSPSNSDRHYHSDDSENERKKPRREETTIPASPWRRLLSGPSSNPTNRRRRRLSSPPPPFLSLINSDGSFTTDEGGPTQDLATPIFTHPSIPTPSFSQIPEATANTLTWQPAEITGHHLDPRNPDDDGEGINGVGFRPTPAIAFARSQRRKQQVSEWKAREAREARQRRFERRRGGGGGVGGLETGGGAGVAKGRRTVRFAGVL